ncbi:MAG: hypothetical protein GF309_05045 [Candidatus Lokiarchaeota archaeon]|nr:hypothetical protein [Candidatus Lokiarchaeota archaeon]
MNKQDIFKSNKIARLATLRHNDYVSSVSWHPDIIRLATSSIDGTAVIWDGTSGKRIATFSLEKGFFEVVWSPDGSRLATRDRGYVSSGHSKNSKRLFSVRIWETRSCKEPIILLHDDRIDEIAWHPDGDRIATGSDDGTVNIWDTKTGSKLATLHHRDLVEEVSWSPDGSKLATGSWDNTARVWNPESGDELFRIDKYKTEGGVAWGAVAWSHDGMKIATASKNQTIIIWDAREWKRDAILQAQHNLSLVKWSPRGNRLLAGVHYTPDTPFPHRTDTKCYLSIWDVEQGLDNAVWKHDGIMREVVWNPDGKKIAIGLDNGTVYILDARTGTELVCMNHDKQILSMDWTPDGTRLATGSKDNTAAIWDFSKVKEF